MKIETEVKIPTQANPLEGRNEFKLALTVPRHFEDNWLFDYEDERLRLSHSALRLRSVGRRGWLTFKAPPQPHPWLKIREEIQIEFEDPQAMRSILEAIGLRPFFQYQKFRTIYRVTLPTEQSLDAMFDETPLGNFLELEGKDEAITEMVGVLAIPPECLLQSSYVALWMNHIQAQGLPMEHMVFSQDLLAEE